MMMTCRRRRRGQMKSEREREREEKGRWESWDIGEWGVWTHSFRWDFGKSTNTLFLYILIRITRSLVVKERGG
jgi:hypothetical protein